MNDQAVYVVDDDALIRRSTVFYLEVLGYTVSAFASGREFLDASAHLGKGCVLLDVRMPGLNGLEVLASLAPRLAQFPVIILTGHGDIRTAVRAMKLGSSDFIEKPFEEQLLRDMLAQVFARLDREVDMAAERRAAQARLSRLTRRETAVLRHLVAGEPNKVIAFHLGLSTRTVEMHRSNMMERLGIRTLSEALRLAFDGGLRASGDAPQDQSVHQGEGASTTEGGRFSDSCPPSSVDAAPKIPASV